MTRYEHAGKFWTIARDGSVLTITAGKIGNKGRTSTKHHANAAAAIAAHAKLVVEKQRAGYRIVETAEPPARTSEPPSDLHGAALEAAIAADPDDAHAYAVYGDWLQKHADPRGELIALQQAGAKDAGKHLAEHARELLGPLAPIVPDIRQLDGLPFTWRDGFIRRAELASAKGRELDDLVRTLFAHPSGRFLVELAVRCDERREALAILHTVKSAPSTLRDFDLFARANLDRIDVRLPALHALGITARAFELVGLETPQARRARFRAKSIASSTVEAIAAAPWPVLERLEIRFCAPSGASEADLHDLRPLLRRADMPALTHLRLRGCAYAGAIARELAASPLSRQLQLLDFSGGNFTPQDVAALATAAANFPNLVELWMPSQAKLEPLAAVAKRVIPDAKAPLDTLDTELA